MTATPAPYRSSWWQIVLVLCVSSLLYFHAFGDTPVYLGGDEARFASEAASIRVVERGDREDHLRPLAFARTPTA